MVEAGLVETLDAVRHQKVAVGDHAGEASVVADARDDLVQIGMGERFAARNGDDAGAEAGEMVDAAEHLVDRDGLGDLVVLVAIGAGEVAEAHGTICAMTT